MSDDKVGTRPVKLPLTGPLNCFPGKGLLDPVKATLFHELQIAIGNFLLPPEEGLGTKVGAEHS